MDAIWTGGIQLNEQNSEVPDSYGPSRKLAQRLRMTEIFRWVVKWGGTSATIRKQFGFYEPICGRLMTPELFEEEVPLGESDANGCRKDLKYIQCLCWKQTLKNTGRSLYSMHRKTVRNIID